MAGDWLDRWFGTILSVAIHVALLLGATLVAFEYLVFFDVGERSGFASALRDESSVVQPLGRSPDPIPLRRRLPGEQDPPFEELLQEDRRPALSDGPEMPGGFVTAVACYYFTPSGKGVHSRNCCWSDPTPFGVRQPLLGYADRLRSLQQNRSGTHRMRNLPDTVCPRSYVDATNPYRTGR